MKLSRILSPLVICAAVLQAPVAAEDSTQAAEFSDRVEVNEVLLDVLVTDADGNVIVGLDQDDFIVEEEGAVVPVTGSTFFSNRELLASGPDASGTLASEISEDRYFIFFLHDQRTAVPRLTTKYLELARQTEDWIRDELLPNDWVAVVRYEYKLEVYSDFTRDDDKLIAAVYDAARGKKAPEVWPSRLEDAASDRPSLLARLPMGKELRKETTRLYSGLELLADAAGHVLGRKNLLFFSAGFGEPSGIGPILPDPRFYPRTMQALNDNNLAVYSISVVSGLPLALQDALNELADDTGGSFFFNHVGFGSPLEQVLKENSGYYLLSYRSETPAGESGYREVAVRAKNPEFRIKAREGYRFGA